MCFNAPVSIAALLVGTVLNVCLFRATPLPHVRAIVITWQYSLLMQFADALSWTSECPSTQQTISTKLSYLLNITQPIALLVAGMVLLPSLSFQSKALACTIAIAYLVYVYVYANKADKCVKNLNACGHLDYYWWSEMPYGWAVYVITIILLTIVLLPLKFGVLQLAYVLSTLALSTVFYNCGTPSVWCFFQVLAPLYTYLTIT
jgi:uncharacterized membrane protein (DUF441 family)